MINSFRGQYSCFSNFHFAAQKVGATTWSTNEHFFVANKTLIRDEQIAIHQAPTAAIAKAMGGPKGYMMPNGILFKITLRENWKDIEIGVMRVGVAAKFDQNPDCHRILMATHPVHLCEGNRWHDNVWGDCSCARCSNTPGLNFLGRLLMEYRLRVTQEFLRPL